MSKVDELKLKHKLTYSEDLFSVPYAPDHQCSAIDEILGCIKWISDALWKVDKLDEEELRDLADDIDHKLYGLDDKLEDLRSACGGIREWGQGWKNACKEVINQYNIDIEL